MDPIDKFTQLAMAVGRLAEGVPEWSYKPHTDNGIRGFRYESRGKAVAFVSTNYVRVGLEGTGVCKNLTFSGKEDE